MPGIFGFYLKLKKNAEEQGKLFSSMRKSLVHRETYSCDQHVHQNFGGGKIDINNKTHRKIYVDSQTNIVVCLFGEIFDYNCTDKDLIEDGKNPEKTVCRIYQRYGEKTGEKLNGDFNLVIFDPIEDRLLICNDRFGFRHLYIYDDDNLFMFSPEIKAFSVYKKFDKSIDEQGLSDYFNFFYHLGDRTNFMKVKLLPPSSCLIVEKNAYRIYTYWQPTYTRERTKDSLAEAIETGYSLFRQSIKRKVAKNKNVLITLTGGFDSRLILSETLKQSGCRVTTATFGNKHSSEYKIARKVCQTLGIAATHLVQVQPEWLYKYADDLICYNECGHANLVLTTLHGFADAMGTDFDCLLNGLYGGHLSFGSPYFTKISLHSDFSDAERNKRLIRGLDGYVYDMFLRKCASPKLNDMVDHYREKTIEEEWERTKKASDIFAYRWDSFFIYNRIRRGMNVIDQNRFFYNDQFPFASYELYDFYLTLAPDLLLDHFLYKEIYKQKLPHLARIPYAATGVNLYKNPSRLQNMIKIIEEKIRWHSKKFSRGKIELLNKSLTENPSLSYRKNKTLREWVEKILLSDRCLERGYYDRDNVVKLLRKERYGGSAFLTISQMIVFELWARSFLDS